MGKIVSFANQKGGVGKTTTTINLASLLGENGYQVLVVDLDPQANATTGLNYEPNNEINIYQLLANNLSINDVCINTDYKNLYLIPSFSDLAAFQVEISEEIENKEFFLKQVLQPINSIYDYILIDLPPSLGLLSVNGLAASDSVLIPLQCEFYALAGVVQLMDTIKLIQNHINPDLLLEGVLLTMYDGRTNLASQVVTDVKNYFSDQVYNTIIPRNVKLSEAPSYGQPINIYDPVSIGSKSYSVFCEEFIKNGKK